MHRQSLPQLVLMNPKTSGALRFLSEPTLARIAQESVLLRLKKGEQVTLRYGGYLLRGAIYLGAHKPEGLKEAFNTFVIPHS